LESLKDVVSQIVERLDEQGQPDFAGRPTRLVAWKKFSAKPWRTW
jgi:hypothetical protein